MKTLDERWYEEQKELGEMFINGMHEEIANYVKENSNHLFSIVSGERIEESQGIFRFGKTLTDEFEEDIVMGKDQLESIYKVGMLSGILKICLRIATEKSHQKSMEQEAEQYFSKISHLNQIVEIIGKNSGLTHTELSQKLDMNVSTLTECMKKIIETNLIEYRSVGRYKFYSLTDKGRRYRRYESYGKLPFLSKEVLQERFEKYLESIKDNEAALNALSRAIDSQRNWVTIPVEKEFYMKCNGGLFKKYKIEGFFEELDQDNKSIKHLFAKEEEISRLKEETKDGTNEEYSNGKVPEFTYPIYKSIRTYARA